jgi:cation:H+ antiporter
MTLALAAVACGLIILIWGADRFVDGAAAVATHLGVPPLLIGMVIVGFGTSAPEMVVSAIAAYQGNPGLALGNAFGSNIANIGLILGVAALIRPVAVQSGVLRKELPVLMAVTALVVWLMRDMEVSRADAWVILALFAGLMGWTVYEGVHERSDALGAEMDGELKAHPMPMGRAIFWLVLGLVALTASSRALVWGAVEIAHALGVSDLIIGLTVVALGTSLPELASSIAAVRKGEDDIALGNVLGSNLFNTLAVVGIAGAIHPIAVPTEALARDCVVMGALTLSIFVFGYGFRGRMGRINRVEAGVLVAAYVAYSAVLVGSVLG